MLDNGEVTTHTDYGKVQIVNIYYAGDEFQGAYFAPLTEDGINQLAKDTHRFDNLHCENDKNKLSGV
jgi:hypothetical protein